MGELEERQKKLKIALAKSEAKKEKWPTVQVPRSGFKRLPKIESSY